jgi:methylase of polypeptide subunit release factors
MPAAAIDPAAGERTRAALVHWTEAGEARSARWQSESGLPPPTAVVIADDTLSADEACRLAARGAAMLWRGDYHNARHLVDAMARRIERRQSSVALRAGRPATALDAFQAHRARQAERARMLAMVVLEVDAGDVLRLRRAPDVRDALRGAHGTSDATYLIPLRELLGAIGAHEWRRKGIAIAPLGGARIHPHYGVFSPIRSEYVDLVARAPFTHGSPGLAFDIGAGTGVLAAILARRGAARVVATDNDPRALACARENVARLGMRERIEIVAADLFPPDDSRADLAVCNPPWLPGIPSSTIENAIFDRDSAMLRGFLAGLPAHLTPRGEGWLILSDFAEHLGLRTRDALLGWIEASGLSVSGRMDARPRHPKAADPNDPLHAARSAEVVSLWRLVAQEPSMR